jgi:DNA-binding transcriptional LysR family regulator
MDVKWLEDFLSLAEYRSFTKASRERNTSQSGMSRRIQSLEHWAGVQLVDRTVKPLQLTVAGKRFLPLAANLRASLVAARSICSRESATYQPLVTLAVAEGMESGMLPGLLARLRERGVDVTVRALARGVDVAPLSLLEGDADLWLAPQHAQLPLALDPLCFETVTVARDLLSPLTAPDAIGRPLHFLPGQPGRPTPLIEYRRSDYFAQVSKVLLSRGPMHAHVAQAGEADSLHFLRSMAMHGIGVAFLPESMVREELQRGELVRLDPRWSAEIEIQLVRVLRPQGQSAHGAADLIWQCLARESSEAASRGVRPYRHVHQGGTPTFPSASV